MTDDQTIHLSAELQRLRARAQAAYREIGDYDATPLATIIDTVERAVIEAAMAEHRTLDAAAVALSLNRRSLKHRLMIYGITESRS